MLWEEDDVIQISWGSYTILDTSGLDIDDLKLEGRWLEFSTTSRQIEALRITVDTNANDEAFSSTTSVGVRPCRVRAVSPSGPWLGPISKTRVNKRVTIEWGCSEPAAGCHAPAASSPRLNCERQAVLLRRSRARGEGCERLVD